MLDMIDTLIQALDPVIWAKERLGFTCDPWQAAALRSESKRVIYNCARQTGKSTIAAMRALYQAVFEPNSLVLLLSPSLRQSSELQRKVDLLALALSELEYQEHSKLSLMLANGSRIISLPGIEGTVRGYSAVTLLVEDEAAQVQDDFYKTVRPMLAVSGGTFILMSTPHGKQGHFFYEWTKGGADWERTEIKARDCPRIAPEFLEEERKTLGDRWFRQEYCNSFEDMEDSVFSPELVDAAFDETVKPLFGDLVTADVKPLFAGRRRDV